MNAYLLEIILGVIVGLILILFGLIFSPIPKKIKVIWLKITNKNTRIIICRYTKPIPKSSGKVTLKRIGGVQKIKDSWIPLIQNEPSNTSEIMFVVLFQNPNLKGTDTSVILKLDFYDICIRRVEIQTDRLEIIEGGVSGASIVTIRAKELLPGERQSVRIFVQNNEEIKIHSFKAISNIFMKIPVYICNVTYEKHSS